MCIDMQLPVSEKQLYIDRAEAANRQIAMAGAAASASSGHCCELTPLFGDMDHLLKPEDFRGPSGGQVTGIMKIILLGFACYTDMGIIGDQV